jgi:hypothetical protein
MKAAITKMLRGLDLNYSNFGHQKSLEMPGDNIFLKIVAKIMSMLSLFQ